MFYQFNHLASSGYFKIERDKNFSFPSHLHQCFELIVLLSGKMQVNVDNAVYELKKGEALLVFPNQIHSLHSTESEHILCIFAPDLVKEYATRVANKIPNGNLFVPDGYFVSTLCNLESNSTTTQKKGILYSLCGEFDRGKKYSTGQADNKGILNRIFAFVEESFSSDCSLKRLSKTTGYDYAYLSRMFRRIVGISYNSYVNHYRLSHVCYLLENTDYSIIQCALESGYDSVRSLNYNFKAHLGMTPSEYRSSVLKTIK
ncbi:MAG: AraC family transcriptional regulator [Ruminococcaceae bacterium]|nr:AraC family transcriptional regulator [Oscillospiraceae bacterium]